MLISLPLLPKFKNSSPEIVQVLDKIRFELSDVDEYSEFNWFAREYPRCYRYHLDHVEFRLQEIYGNYQTFHKNFEKVLETKEENFFGMSISEKSVYEIYWNFESYLSAVSSALDILARIVGTAYEEQTPVSFNKICGKKNLLGLVDILRQARLRWVLRMKDYRDCFVHYTPVDTVLAISLGKYADGWEVRGKIPINPNARDILRFKFSRRVELLKYSIGVYKHMFALDRAVAREIHRLYVKNEFPKRIQNLFFVGGRSRG